MTEWSFACPYCGATVSPQETVCPACHEDLAALIQLEYGYAIHYNEALDLARRGALDEARELARLSIRLNDRFAPAHALLAKIEARQGRWDMAQKSIQRAVQLAPDERVLRELESLIFRLAEEARIRQEARAKAAALRRRRQAERYLAMHRRDMLVAFALGALVVSIVVVFARLFLGQGRQR